jgi:hypothetical protein
VGSSSLSEAYGADIVSKKASSRLRPCSWPLEKWGGTESLQSSREGRELERYGTGVFELI